MWSESRRISVTVRCATAKLVTPSFLTLSHRRSDASFRARHPPPDLTPMRSTSPDFDIHIRLARLADVAALTHHRVSMFRDMSELPPHLEPELAHASEAFFHASVASGEYIAWLAVTNDAPERVVAGAGLWLRPMLPRPIPTSISQGREGLVANVYTEPDWRRHGVATLLMRHLLDYVREHRIERVRLHASDMDVGSTSRSALPRRTR